MNKSLTNMIMRGAECNCIAVFLVKEAYENEFSQWEIGIGHLTSFPPVSLSLSVDAWQVITDI